MFTNRLFRKVCRQHEARLAAMLAMVLALLSACANNPRQVRIKLKDGTELAGALVEQDDKAVTVVTADGIARTVLTRQIDTLRTEKAASAAPQAQPTAATGAKPIPSTGAAVPAAGAPFVAPANGQMTLRAGTTLNLRPQQSMDAGEAAFTAVYVAQFLDDTALDGGMIPAGTNLTMEVTSPPNSAHRAMICNLLATYPGGKEYRPAEAAGTAGHLPLLGILNSPSAADLPPGQRNIPYRIPASSMFTFKLAQAIVLNAVK